MDIKNNFATKVPVQGTSLDETAASREGKPATIAGKIASIFRFKASFASPQKQTQFIEQHHATKNQLEARIKQIDAELEKLPSKSSIQERDPLKRELREYSLDNTKITLGQEKGRLLEQLSNGEYTLPQPPVAISKTLSSSVSSQPNKTDLQAKKDSEAKLQYQKDKRQIAVNEKIMNQPPGVLTAFQKTAIAEDTWNRQLKVEEYEKNQHKSLQE